MVWNIRQNGLCVVLVGLIVNLYSDILASENLNTFTAGWNPLLGASVEFDLISLSVSLNIKIYKKKIALMPTTKVTPEFVCM